MSLFICLITLLISTSLAGSSCDACENNVDEDLYEVSLLQTKMAKELAALGNAATDATLHEAMDKTTDLDYVDEIVGDTHEEEDDDEPRALLTARTISGWGRRRRRKIWGSAGKSISSGGGTIVDGGSDAINSGGDAIDSGAGAVGDAYNDAVDLAAQAQSLAEEAVEDAVAHVKDPSTFEGLLPECLKGKPTPGEVYSTCQNSCPTPKEIGKRVNALANRMQDMASCFQSIETENLASDLGCSATTQISYPTGVKTSWQPGVEMSSVNVCTAVSGLTSLKNKLKSIAASASTCYKPIFQKIADESELEAVVYGPEVSVNDHTSTASCGENAWVQKCEVDQVDGTSSEGAYVSIGGKRCVARARGTTIRAKATCGTTSTTAVASAQINLEGELEVSCDQGLAVSCTCVSPWGLDKCGNEATFSPSNGTCSKYISETPNSHRRRHVDGGFGAKVYAICSATSLAESGYQLAVGTASSAVGTASSDSKAESGHQQAGQACACVHNFGIYYGAEGSAAAGASLGLAAGLVFGCDGCNFQIKGWWSWQMGKTSNLAADASLMVGYALRWDLFWGEANVVEMGAGPNVVAANVAIGITPPAVNINWKSENFEKEACVQNVCATASRTLSYPNNVQFVPPLCATIDFAISAGLGLLPADGTFAYAQCHEIDIHDLITSQ